jgi:hypothetical protein
MRVERQVTIAASPEAVYDLVMDPHRLAEWVAIHAWVREAPEGPLVEGSDLVQGFRLAGFPFEVRWRVTQAERPVSALWEGRGPGGSRARVSYGVQPAGSGAVFDYVNEFALPGGPFMAAAAPLITAQASRDVDTTLSRLRALLEAPAGSPG